MAVAGERRVAIVVLPAAAHLKSGGWEEMTVT